MTVAGRGGAVVAQTGGGGGAVSSVADAGAGTLTISPTTGAVKAEMASAVATPGTYGGANRIPEITLDTYGRATGTPTTIAPQLGSPSQVTGIGGLIKAWAVTAVATTNVNIASAPATVDGVTLNAGNGDVILLTNQTTASQNGIWGFNGTGNALSRGTYFATGVTLYGMMVNVNEGNVNGGTRWQLLAGSGGVLVDTSPQDWVPFTEYGRFNVKSFGALGNGTADDTTAIQNAITAAEATGDGGIVYFPAGIYATTADLYISASGIGLLGDVGAQQSVNDDTIGAIILPLSSWASTHPTQGAGVILFDGTTPIYNNSVRGLIIDGAALPVTADGIRAFGAVSGFTMDSWAVDTVTGAGLNAALNGTTFGDGWQVKNGHTNLTGLAGVSGYYLDSVFDTVHVQSANTAQNGVHNPGTANDAAGWSIAIGNCRFVDCRGDLVAGTSGNAGGYGWHVESSLGITSGSGGYDTANAFTNCGTQRNNGMGMLIDNTSSGGTTYRGPISLNNCSFEGDGVQSATWTGGSPTNGQGGASQAGLAVSGRNYVTVSGGGSRAYTIDMGHGGATACPAFGVTVFIANPNLATVTIHGGFWNCDSAGTVFHNGTTASNGAASFFVTPDTLTSIGYESTTITPACALSPSVAPGIGDAYYDLGSSNAALTTGAGVAVLTSASLPPGVYDVTAVATVTGFTGTAGNQILAQIVAGTTANMSNALFGNFVKPAALTTAGNDGVACVVSGRVVLTGPSTLVLQIYTQMATPGSAIAQDTLSGTTQVTYMVIRRRG